MKLKSIVICVLFVFIFINLSGCDEIVPKDNFIYVIVSATSRVGATSIQKEFNGSFYKDIPGMEIDMEILKAGAIKKTESYTTNLEGDTPKMFHTVKVYKEQNVAVKAYLKSVLPQDLINEGYSVESYKYLELTWNQIYTSTDWEGTYNWYPILFFNAEIYY